MMLRGLAVGRLLLGRAGEGVMKHTQSAAFGMKCCLQERAAYVDCGMEGSDSELGESFNQKSTRYAHHHCTSDEQKLP